MTEWPEPVHRGRVPLSPQSLAGLTTSSQLTPVNTAASAHAQDRLKSCATAVDCSSFSQTIRNFQDIFNNVFLLQTRKICL